MSIQLVSLAILVLVGCSRVPDGNARVTGQVLIPDGAAYTLGGAMLFEPDEVAIRGTHTSLGMLDDQGRFERMTVAPKDQTVFRSDQVDRNAESRDRLHETVDNRILPS